jgi:hypothetical protein
MNAVDPVMLRAIRLTIGGCLLGWLYGLTRGRMDRFAQFAAAQVVDDFFPAALSSPLCLVVLYVAPVPLGLWVLVRPRIGHLRVFSLILAACAAGLALHPRTFAIQVFTTVFWTALWLTWAAANLHRADSRVVLRKACFLAQVIVSLIFLGAAAGKWTDEYWSGQVLHTLMFVYQETSFYPLLREHLSETELVLLAGWYSKAVVVGETIFAASFMVPPRIAFACILPGLLGMWVLSTPHVIEPLAPLMGLALGGFLLSRELSQMATDGEPQPANTSASN